MKFFKSVTAIALSLTMVMGLAACGGSAEPEQNAPDEQQGEAPSGDVKTSQTAKYFIEKLLKMKVEIL